MKKFPHCLPKVYGLTLHELTCGIDEGAIIVKGVLPLDRTKPVLDLYLDSVPVGTEMLLRHLKAIKDGKPIPSMTQTPVAKSYYPNPTSQEFTKYVRNAVIYADPEKSPERLAGLFAGKDTILHARLIRELSAAIENQEVPALPVSLSPKAKPSFGMPTQAP